MRAEAEREDTTHVRIDPDRRTWVVRRVAAPPERVFAVLSDGWLYPVWVVGATRMRDVDPAWPQSGAQLHHSFGIWPAVIDDRTSVLAWDPPRRLVLRARGWPLGVAEVELVVEPTGRESEVRICEEPTDGPLLLVPRRVRDFMIAVRNVETLRRLAFLAEGDAR